ncbi:MAG: PKD domain-containing protein, partial [Bacteroidota bacterium]
YEGVLIANPGDEECTDTGFITLNLFPPIEADFTAVFDSCSPDPIPFTDLTVTGASALDTWNWDFGNGESSTESNPIYAFPDPGSFEVELIAEDVNGCADTVRYPINWFPAPHLDWTADDPTNCTPRTVNFTNTSVPTNPDYVYQWDFGDGNTSNQFSPSNFYGNLGTYDVSLMATSPLGCTATETRPEEIGVFNPPSASFSVNPSLCDPDPIPFTNLSLPGDGTVTEWDWDFGDGNTSNDQNPVHQYLEAGSYQILLTMEDEYGCTDQVEQTIDWFPRPVTLIQSDVTGGCQPLTVEFTNNSFPINGYTILWDFGDGNTSDQVSPIHTYSDLGIYTVSLSQTSPTGCTASEVFSDLISVGESPTPQFSVNQSTCNLAPIVFQDESSSAITAIASWFWEFGDGSTSEEQNPSHLFNQAGSFDVQLTVTNAAGCAASIQQTVDWFPAAELQVMVDQPSGCSPHSIVIQNNSFPVNGYSTVWNFGDGNTTDVINPVHTYEQSGVFPISLEITSPTGCVAQSVVEQIEVLDPPTANFDWLNAADSCNAGPIAFSDLSLPGDEQIDQWFWDFGDGTTSTEQNPIHQYTNAGTYSIALLVTDQNGCTDQTSRSLNWAPAPEIVVLPSATSGCTPLTVQFDNQTPDQRLSNLLGFWGW